MCVCLRCCLQQGVGVEGPLVDDEGYPRADVNVYQIRTARHNISCKQQCVFVSGVFYDSRGQYESLIWPFR